MIQYRIVQNSKSTPLYKFKEPKLKKITFLIYHFRLQNNSFFLRKNVLTFFCNKKKKILKNQCWLI